MSTPDISESGSLARTFAAQQQAPSAAQQSRGPKPLPVFLDIAARAVRHDRARLAAVLAGVRAYQAHPYARALPAPPALAQVGAARLLDYGGAGPAAVFVPSLINPPTVLDLAEGNSLLRWLAGQGVRPLLVDWGTPGADERRLSIDGYVEERLLPLLTRLGEPAALVGYCLGGTMTLAAAASAGARRLALVAAPWRFDRYPRPALDAVARHWAAAEPAAARLGAVPMEMIQPMFWLLDPAGAAAKFAQFAGLPQDGAPAQAFVALEDWANDGPPLSLPAARQLFERLYAGAPAPLPALGIPVLNLVAMRDRIVPPAAAPEIGHRVEIDAGHVGMIVGSKGPALLWPALRDFLTG